MGLDGFPPAFNPKEGWDCHFSCTGNNRDPFDCKPKGWKDVKNGDTLDRLQTFNICYTLNFMSETHSKLSYFHDLYCDFNLFLGMCMEGSSREECKNPQDLLTRGKCKALEKAEEFYGEIMKTNTKMKKDLKSYQKNRKKIIDQNDNFTDLDI